MRSNSITLVVLLSVLCVGAFLLGTSSTSTAHITPQIERNINWESDDARTCVLKLMGYSSSRYGSSYYLLDIARESKTLLKFNVQGRQVPKVQLGAPVRSQCITIDDTMYAYHENVKNDFVVSTTKAERNRLWVADEAMIRQMDMD